MTELKDSLYDIRDAVALSQRLIGATKPQAGEAESPYIRFSSGLKQVSKTEASIETGASSDTEAASERPAVIVADRPPPPEEPFRSWEDVLKWSIEVSKGSCGFIVDSQGFVMMMHGEDLPSDRFEGAGANLGVVFGYLNKMEIESGDVRIADLTYEKRSMLAIRVTDAQGEYCTMGILGMNAIHPWPKHAIYHQIMKNMSNLLL